MMMMNASHAAHKIKKMSKEHSIVMLPSEGPSMILFDTVGNELVYNPPVPQEKTVNVKPQHLYILSDEEIKEGDWYYNELDKAVRKNNTINHSYHKKIIATTDVLALNKGYSTTGGIVPQIPKHIIEAYVKKPFDKVVVEYPDYILKTRVMRCPYYWDKQGKCMRRGKCLCAVVEPKLSQDGTLAVSLVESGYYAIYDEVTNKTLHIQAPSLKDAEIIAAAIDFDNFVDGQSILTNPSVSLVEEKIEVDKLKLIEGLGRLRLTSDEELRAKYPLKPQVGMGIDWDKWIKENL